MKRNQVWRKLALATFVLTTAACSTVEDIEIQDAVGANITNASDLNVATVGLYNRMQEGRYLGGYVQQFSDLRGGDVGARSFFTGLNNGLSQWTEFWTRSYQLINQANIVLASAPALGSAATVNEGEALFARSQGYFVLLMYHAQPYSWDGGAAGTATPTGTGQHVGVIIRSQPVLDGTQNSAPRSTVAAVWSQIFADLDLAETRLPNRATGTTWASGGISGGSRATVDAAIAMKLRSALHIRDYNRAVTEGNKLFELSLVPTPGRVLFKRGLSMGTTPQVRFTSPNSVENLFYLENSATDNSRPTVNESMVSFYNVGARAILAINGDIWANTGTNTAVDTRYTVGTVASGSLRFLTKYTDVANRADFVPIITLGEAALNYAEALANLAPGTSVDTSAVKLLNLTRVRAGNAAFTAADFASKSALITAIHNERRIELLGEGHNYFNNLRIGVGSGVDSPTSVRMRGGASLTVLPQQWQFGADRIIWPVPQSELDNNRLFGAQIPGW